MANTVTFKIKIEGSNDLRSVTVDANELGKAFAAVQANVKGLKSELVTLSSTVQLIEGFSSAISQLHGFLSGLSTAYAAQESAETRLAQAMRNTMGATDEEIRAIKELTAAQQEIGIVGDEVQLAAAQELATYLEFSDSLKTIIPVLNDMIAQQLGLGASAESATQIATMLGKVMNGQTEALSRYGYKFDEAQKLILKYGDESERAAVLAEVVSEAVGGMNEAMARTPSGKMQQVSNAIGDVKEMIGQAVQGAMPFISTLAEISMAASGILKLSAAFSALGKSQLLAKAHAIALSAAQKVQAALTKTLVIAQKQASVSTKALTVNIAALEAAMTMGLSIAITAVISLIAKLASKSKEASGAVEEIDEASEAFTQAARDARSELAMYQVKLEDIIKHHKNDAAAVKELNEKYGESFGYYNTASSWYDVLTRKSAVYCRQIGYEAQAKVIASQRAQKQLEQDAVKERLLQLRREGKDAQRKVFGLVHDADGKVAGWGTEYRYVNQEYADLLKQYKDLGGEIAGLEKQFTSCTQGMAAAQQELQAALEGTDTAAGWQQMSLEQLTKAIKDQKAVVESLAGVDDERGLKENRLLKQMEARANALKAAYGLASSSGSAGANNLQSAIESYRLSIQRAIEVNQALKNGKDENNVELSAMESGIKSLIGQYGSESAAIRELIEEYNALLKARRDASRKIPLLEKVQGLQGGNQIKLDATPLKNWEKQTEAAKLSTSDFGVILESLSGTVRDLGGALGDSAAKWASWAANIISAVGRALPAILAMTAARKEEATAAAAAATTEGAAAVAGIPIAGPVLAIGAVASIIAAFAAIPKFAHGGIAYGPTLGLFGEYPGAATNPEVVAPLDKLRSFIREDVNVGGNVRFRIEGRDLVGIIERESNIRRRS